MSKTKKDLLLAVIILAVAAAGFSINYLIQREPAAQLEVKIDGQTVRLLDLDRDADITIDGWDGGMNHLTIKDGAAWVDEASCPDKVCIHQGKVRLNGQIIVCMPNRMTAQVVGGEEP